MERATVSVHPAYADTPDEGERGWWPLDCLRSLGRAASIAAAGFAYLQWHGAYRGFGIFTTGDNGNYSARIRLDGGQPIQTGEQLQRYIDAARFDSREEAAQHARFVIASGALSHLLPAPTIDGWRENENGAPRKWSAAEF
jgi:hypothetical protein